MTSPRPGESKGARRALPRNQETSLPEADDFRATLHRSEIAHVEDSSVSPVGPPPRGYEPHYQIVFPYFGFFAYGVGRRRWLMDSNSILFISPGWEFQDEHPVKGMGHAAVLVNPARELLDEVCGGLGPNKCQAFIGGAHPSSMRLSLLTQQMLHPDHGANDPLRNDELVVHALQEAINGAVDPPGRASKIADRAKELLHARGCERLTLDQIAKDVGVSPVYLTQDFHRSEGVPLYRYQLQLRLSRALLELPHCDDITGLALDLGFSSHSHFSCAFKKVFGLSPSEYRQGIGTGRLFPNKRGGQACNLRAA